MVHKKPAVTAKVLQALLIRIGSASSGTKSTLLARFQRKIQQPGVFHRPSEGGKQPRKPWNRKLRVMSIDMGIKNLAFCDAEVTYSATESASEPNLGATMNVLRWKKIDLVGSAYNNKDHLLPEKGQEVMESTEDDADPYSPSVLSKTAHRLITEEVLSTSPDIILIEKQRWRSGGGSAVQQWTVRVNTLEAMLWAILETLKAAPPHQGTNAAKPKHDYNVYAIDPKRVGQYWLSGHARALRERRNEATPAPNASTPQSPPSQDKSRDKARTTTRPNKKQPSRARAEKAAKINILRSWLSPPTMSTEPSTPSLTPRIGLAISPAAQPTLDALLPPCSQSTAPPLRRQRKRTTKTEETERPATAGEAEEAQLADVVPAAAERKKLDDVTDCFLQAAAWVAWEVNRVQLRAVGDRGALESSSGEVRVGDEDWIVRAVEGVGEV